MALLLHQRLLSLRRRILALPPHFVLPIELGQLPPLTSWLELRPASISNVPFVILSYHQYVWLFDVRSWHKADHEKIDAITFESYQSICSLP